MTVTMSPWSPDYRLLVKANFLQILHEWRVWRGPVLMVLGLSLFWHSRRLAESLTFHYASGITLGAIFGVLILGLIIHRYFGKRFSGLFASAFVISSAGGEVQTRDSILPSSRWDSM